MCNNNIYYKKKKTGGGVVGGTVHGNVAIEEEGCGFKFPALPMSALVHSHSPNTRPSGWLKTFNEWWWQWRLVGAGESKNVTVTTDIGVILADFSCFLSSTLGSRGSASGSLPIEPTVGLANGRGGLRLPELALAAGKATIRDPASHHTGLDLLKVICLSRDFGLQKTDVSLISGLLLGEQRREDRKHRIETRVMVSTLILYSV